MTKIMLVEDDNNLREIYEARLSAEGFEIVAAQNGEAALALAAKEHPDMIISDVMMPKISGFEMLDILRNTESLRNVKIIMLTALGQAEDSQRANNLGADRYLVKSQVTLEDIVKAAHELLDNPEDSPTTISGAEITSPDTPTAAPAVAAEPAPEPEEPAVSAVSQPVPVVTAEEPIPAPAPAPEPAAPLNTMPVIEPAPFAAQPVEPPAPEPVNPPAPQVDAPAPAAAQVISIPVSDGPSDSDGQSAVPADPMDTGPITEDTPEVASESAGMPVVEPPADLPSFPTDDAPTDTPSEPAASSFVTPSDDNTTDSNATDSTQDTVTEETPDYTSPESFNKFQVPPTEPNVTAEPLVTPETAAPQSAEDAEASMKAQIDDFIQNGAAVTPEPALETAAPAVDTSIGVVADAGLPTASDDDILSQATSVVSDDIPNAEELDTFQAPTIKAPDDPSASADTTEQYDDQLVTAAAEGLASSAPETPQGDPVTASNEPLAASSAGTKVITPITPTDSKPTLDQLLEKEEAKNAAQQAAASTQPAKPNVDVYTPASQTSPQQPPADNKPTVDPNSISL